jgi:hypothetical protein
MSLEIIPLKNNVLREVRFNEVKHVIISRLQELKLLDKRHILDAEFINYVMNVIEHLVQKKDKIDKKELIFCILRDIFCASEDELQTIEKTMEFLLSNKAVKRVSFYKIFKAGVCEWFSKRLGLKT